MAYLIGVIGDRDPTVFSKLDVRDIEFTELQRCDLALYGRVVWSEPSALATLKELDMIGHRLNKPILVMVVDDYELDLGDFNWLIMLRTSLKASLRKPNELVLPYIWECQDQPFDVLAYTGTPIIGFCGLGSAHRQQLLSLLAAQPDFETHFIIHDRFWGGRPHDPELVSAFQANLRDCHFVVAQRGAGNFSMRFYQTLAAGRIPVLLDTDLCLPYDHEIDWEASIVISPSLERIPRLIRALCQQGHCEAVQRRCAAMFNQHFRHLSLSAILSSLAQRWTFAQPRGYESVWVDPQG